MNCLSLERRCEVDSGGPFKLLFASLAKFRGANVFF